MALCLRVSTRVRELRKFSTNVMNRGADLLHHKSARMGMASPLPCGALVGGEVFDK